MFLQLMDRNPEFAQVLNNPQQLQEAMQAASNPVSAACCKAPNSIESALLQNLHSVNLASLWYAASVQGACLPSLARLQVHCQCNMPRLLALLCLTIISADHFC